MTRSEIRRRAALAGVAFECARKRVASGWPLRDVFSRRNWRNERHWFRCTECGRSGHNAQTCELARRGH